MSAPFVQLGSIARFLNGAIFKPEDWGESGMRIIRIQNLTDSTRAFNRTQRVVDEDLHVRPGDLLVSWSATLGVFEWAGPDVAVLNQHIFRVLPDERHVVKRYLRHGLEAALLDMRRHLHGATMKHVNRGEFLGTKLFLPSLAEQHRIAELLDRAEALRAKRRASLLELDSLAHALFLDLFGDPVTNPKGFGVSRLGDVCDVRDGTHASPKYVSEGGHPLVTSRNLTGGTVDLSEVNFISQADYDQINKRSKVHRGDLLMPMIGTIGSPVLVEHEPRYAIKNVALIKFTEDSPSAVFVRHLLSCHYFDSIVGQKNRGGTQKFISLGDLRAFPLPLPPLPLQREFAGRVEALERLRTAYRASLTELEALFASLQDRAFRGEL